MTGMTVIADTLKAKERLIEAGFEDAKAEGIIAIFREADTQVATKFDLELFRKDVKDEIEGVKVEISGLKAEIEGLTEGTASELEKLSMKLTIRLGTIMAGGIALVLAGVAIILTRFPM